KALPRMADLLAEAAPVLAHVLGRVLGQQPEIERVERAAGHAALARGEDQPRAGQLGGYVTVVYAERLGESHGEEGTGERQRQQVKGAGSDRARVRFLWHSAGNRTRLLPVPLTCRR